MIQFERGWRMRRSVQMKTGLMQCKDAILNTVGLNARALDKEIIKKMMKEEEKQRRLAVRTPEQRLGERRSKMEVRRETRKKEKMERRQDKVLLGQVAGDASFLRNILQPVENISQGKMSDEQVSFTLYFIFQMISM